MKFENHCEWCSTPFIAEENYPFCSERCFREFSDHENAYADWCTEERAKLNEQQEYVAEPPLPYWGIMG